MIPRFLITAMFTVAVAFILLLAYEPLAAQEFYDLKAKSVHCATPQPIVSGDIYPLVEKDCAIVGTVWGLLEQPVEIQPGVMKVSMPMSYRATSG